MKPVPVIIALLTAALLYVMVFERDWLLSLATSGPDTAPQAAQTQADPTSSPAAQSPGVFSVMAIASQARAVDNAVILRGQTEAARQVEVRSQASGLVISEPLRKGVFVARGDILCAIDPGTLPAQLVEAQARLAEAQIENTAAERLAEGGFASETRKVSARANLEAAAAGIDRAQTEINRLEIKAPFDGLLESDAAELGSLLQPGAPCATVLQLNPIKLVGFLPEISVEAVSLGAPATARLANGTTVAGKVTFLSRSADPETRTFRVEIAVPNEDLAIRDGQSADIAIAAAGVSAHLIPQSALTLDNNGTMGLRIVEAENKVGFAPVSIVRDTSDGIWVTGLPDRATVITVGQEYVTNGVTVNPVIEEPRQ